MREGAGHALIGARQWIPAEQIDDADTAAAMGLPADLRLRTKGQLAIDICTDAYAYGVRFDVICGDEVYGGCTQLRECFEHHQQAYVLRVACTFMLDPGAGLRLTCQQAVQSLLADRQWEVRSAGQGRRDNGVTRGRRSPPPAPDTWCWHAGTYAPVTWPSTTATCPRGNPRP